MIKCCDSDNFSCHDPDVVTGSHTCKLHKDSHEDAIKWKHFPRYWPFVRGIHRSPVNSPHKGQWCGALVFSLICAWINSWVNNREAGDLRRHRAHYDVIVMYLSNVDPDLCCYIVSLGQNDLSQIKMDPISTRRCWMMICFCVSKLGN